MLHPPHRTTVTIIRVAPHVHHPLHSRHHLTWTGAAIGLSIHSLIEGIALAASVEAGRISLAHNRTA
jgi:zinc transporter ZupT